MAAPKDAAGAVSTVRSGGFQGAVEHGGDVVAPTGVGAVLAGFREGGGGSMYDGPGEEVWQEEYGTPGD